MQDTKAPPSGLKLKPLEVTVHVDRVRDAGAMRDEPVDFVGECPDCGEDVYAAEPVFRRIATGDMDNAFEALRRAGIDTGRPMWLHFDPIARTVTARQDPWEAE